MLEPIVQDYIRMVVELSREEFLARQPVPFLVAVRALPGQSFQQARTRMMDEREQQQVRRQKFRFDPRAAVIEVQRQRGGMGDVTLGRSEENDIVLDEEEISAQHAVFRFEGKTNRYSLEDFESTNGTFINQTQLIAGRAVELKNRDYVQFGPLPFLFFYPEGFYDAVTAGLPD